MVNFFEVYRSYREIVIRVEGHLGDENELATVLSRIPFHRKYLTEAHPDDDEMICTYYSVVQDLTSHRADVWQVIYQFKPKHDLEDADRRWPLQLLAVALAVAFILFVPLLISLLKGDRP